MDYNHTYKHTDRGNDRPRNNKNGEISRTTAWKPHIGEEITGRFFLGEVVPFGSDVGVFHFDKLLVNGSTPEDPPKVYFVKPADLLFTASQDQRRQYHVTRGNDGSFIDDHGRKEINKFLMKICPGPLPFSVRKQLEVIRNDGVFEFTPKELIQFRSRGGDKPPLEEYFSLFQKVLRTNDQTYRTIQKEKGNMTDQTNRKEMERMAWKRGNGNGNCAPRRKVIVGVS